MNIVQEEMTLKRKREIQIKAKQCNNLSLNEIYEKYSNEIEEYIIDIKNEDIDFILDYTSSIFFKVCLYLTDYDIKDIQNKLSKLYHKLKNLYFFNIMMSLYRKISSIIYDKEIKNNSLNFNISEDIILESIYDYKKNKNSDYKTLELKFKSTTIEKYEFLTEKLKEKYSKEDLFLSYDLLIGDFEEGNILKVKFNDKYLIINDKQSLTEMKNLLTQYGIENDSWYDEDESNKRKNMHKPLSSIKTEEEKEENIKLEEERKKNDEDKKIKNEKVVKSLKDQEKYIKNKFTRTKKNTKMYKNIFSNLQKEILYNALIKDKILKIIPYGSVTQCTNNEYSDLELTIITKNYETATKDDICQIFKCIEDKIDNDKNNEFEIFLEGIRETKRTILLLLRHKETKTEIEINCNNFFSVMNSNLIRNYLVYDARALILLNTIKDWSKIKGINSNNRGYLSSYCYTLMTIFFLQKMKNPLLPIISSTNDLVNLKVSEKEFFIEKNLLQSSELMQKWHTPNKEDTVTTLLLKWMLFYLYLFKEEDYCIDISNKRFTFRYNEAKYLTSFIVGNYNSAYCFIDMFDYTYNPGSYMENGSSEHIKFKEVLKESFEQLLEGKKEFLYQ